MMIATILAYLNTVYSICVREMLMQHVLGSPGRETEMAVNHLKVST